MEKDTQLNLAKLKLTKSWEIIHTSWPEKVNEKLEAEIRNKRKKFDLFNFTNQRHEKKMSKEIRVTSRKNLST